MEDTTDTRAYVDLRFDHDFNDSTHLLARTFYDRYSYYGHYPYYSAIESLPLHPVQLVLNHDEALGESVGTEFQLTQRLFEHHIIVAGLDYRENFRQMQRNFYYEPGFDDIDIERSGRSVGLYAQGEISLLTNLTLNAGMRYDNYNTFGGTFNPRLALIYSPWRRSIFKALYGEAFRAPNEYELYYEVPGYNRASPNLLPETIATYELVYEQYLPADLRFSASGYHYEMHDMIAQRSDALGQLFYGNVDEARATGVELELEHRSDSGLLARLSYACQRAEEARTGKELDNSPRHLTKLNLILPLYHKKVFAGFELLYASHVTTLTEATVDPFAIANVTLFGQKLLKNLDVSATIYNVFDTTYSYPGAEEHRQKLIEQDGRSFRLKLTYRF